MGWFGNRNRDDSSKSTRKETLTGKNRRDVAPQTSVSLTNSSYVAPTNTATTNLDFETNEKHQSEHTQQDYSQQEYSEDVEDQQVDTSPSMTTDIDRRPTEDEDAMNEKRDGYNGEETVNEHSRSYSQAEETEVEEPVYTDVVKQNHLNSLFNGHLMKWKFEAEEGSGFIRIPACKLKLYRIKVVHLP
jgi:hypothetical protein